MKNIFLALSLILLNTQCKKTNEGGIDVSQITYTDYNGNLDGQADKSDWTEDKSWSAAELALFQTPTPDQLTNTETGSVLINPAYPNPAPGTQQWLWFSTSSPALLQIVITDNKLGIKKRIFASTKQGNLSLAYLTDPAIFSNNTNYRIYYGLYSSPDGLFFKGHGDVRISR